MKHKRVPELLISKVMKTLILSALLIFGFSAPNFSKPINDIYSIKEPVFTDEAYINDIPFNTNEIAVKAILDGDEVKLAEEPYVNDIPFNTKAVACEFLLHKMIETSREANVNDIPFSTEFILAEHLADQLTEKYRDERNINDLPDGPNFIICSYENGIPTCVAVKIKMPKKATARQRKIENSDYTIIYPVKFEIPRAEVNKNGGNQEVLVVPGFSL
jgi:hypothetical protein